MYIFQYLLSLPKIFPSIQLLANNTYLCLKYSFLMHKPLLAQKSTTLLSVSFSNQTPNAPVKSFLTLSLMHPFRSLRYNLYPLPILLKILSKSLQNLPFIIIIFSRAITQTCTLICKLKINQ